MVLEVYKVCRKLPENEKFGLISQIQRAAVSITSNIAEGFGRRNKKEKVQFYYIANGSLTEVRNFVFIMRDLGFINEEECKTLFELLSKTQALLIGLISKTKEG